MRFPSSRSPVSSQPVPTGGHSPMAVWKQQPTSAKTLASLVWRTILLQSIRFRADNQRRLEGLFSLANTLRGSQSLWAGTVSSGAGGFSAAGYIGPLSQVTVFIWNKDGSVTTTVTGQAGEGAGTPGRNNTP